jgi:signal transduction histidine kinase
MTNSSQLLNFLVNDLLDLCRIKNGKFTKNETKVLIRQHLEELIDIFMMQAEEKRIQIILECAESVPSEITIDI